MEQMHPPGKIIAQRYRIVDTLGQGGSGTTYQAEDLQTNQQVALKALSLHRMTDWKMIELFEREARVLAQLNHPNIPKYLNYFHVDTPQDRWFYIAQELAPGKSLTELVQSGWRCNGSIVRCIAMQMLEILVYLHELTPSVIHRDIKPSNIIWNSDGQVFLVDFGAVQDTYHNTFMRGSTVVGTYGYMAPEQFRGQAVPATDLYGLGATLLFLLTYRSPADLPTDRLKINFRSRVQVSEESADWLEKMLEPDVEDRFPSAKEALAALCDKQRIKAKSGSSARWKALVGVGVAAVASVTVGNSFKWAVLSSFGLAPKQICNDMGTLRDYLDQGANPNVLGASSTGYKHPLLVCLSGNTDAVALLIAKGANVNFKDYAGKTPLHWAAEFGNKDTVEMLIAKGADIKVKDYAGKTPLHRALYNTGNKDTAEILITKGADINVKDYAGKTPLHQAAEFGNKDTAEILITKGADVNVKDYAGKTPLHWAARLGYKDTVEMFIAKGADIKVKDDEGKTPLHWAARLGYKDTVEILIAKGADINAKDANGKTPLDWVLLRLLKEYEQEGTPHRLTAEMLTAEMLIAKGADVKTKDDEGETPLHLVARLGYKDTVKMLIAKGADVNAKDHKGRTPLYQWPILRDKETVEMFIAKGADINAKDANGETPLHWAVRSHYKDTVEMLIAKGADINAKNDKGITILHLVAEFGYKDTVEMFIAKGADINAKDANGKTPLHWALHIKDVKRYTTKEHILTAEMLIAKGADVKVKDDEGKTPLHRVAELGEKKIAEMLIARGADINAKDANGKTPLHWAVYGIGPLYNTGNKDTVEMLIVKGADVNAKDDEGETFIHQAITRVKNNYYSYSKAPGQTREMVKLVQSHGGKCDDVCVQFLNK